MRSRARSFVVLITAATVGLAGFAVANASSSGALPDSTQRVEQITYVTVEVQGFQLDLFTGLVSMGSRTKLGKPPVAPTIVLSRPHGPLDSVYAWYDLVKQGQPNAPRDFVVRTFDEAMAPVSTFFVVNGYPSRIRVEGSVETITFTGDDLLRQE